MESYLEKLRELDPSDNMDATLDAIMKVMEYARSRRGTEQFKEALSIITEKEEKAREYYLRPLDSDLLYHSLIELHTEISNEEMVKRYNRCLDLRQARKWTILGDCYALMGINKRAATYLKRSLFFGPSEDLVDEVKDTLDKAEKRVMKAEVELPQAMKRAENNGYDLKSSIKLLTSLLDLDRIDEMDPVLKKAMKATKDDQELLYKKGCYLFAKGDYKTALKLFNSLLEGNPKSNNYKRAVNITEEMLKGTI
jgi:tetratricopeptide (TPR) repeat protein